MSELLVEIFNHLLERDEDAKEMQNKVNLELERMLIPYKDKLQKKKKEKMNSTDEEIVKRNEYLTDIYKHMYYTD